MWLNAAFTAIICTSCYAPAFPHSLLSCWKKSDLFGRCPPLPVWASCLHPICLQLRLKSRTWLAMENERIMDEVQQFHKAAFQACWNHMALHILFHLPRKNHCGGITAAAPSPGFVSQLSIAPVLLRAQERQEQGREQAQQAALDHQTLLGSPLPPPAAVGSGPLSKPLSQCSPPSLSSSGSSVLSASLGLSPYLITATKLL